MAVQVGLDSTRNELVLLQVQSEAFKEAMTQMSQLFGKLQDFLVMSEDLVQQYQEWIL